MWHGDRGDERKHRGKGEKKKKRCKEIILYMLGHLSSISTLSFVYQDTCFVNEMGIVRFPKPKSITYKAVRQFETLVNHWEQSSSGRVVTRGHPNGKVTGGHQDKNCSTTMITWSLIVKQTIYRSSKGSTTWLSNSSLIATVGTRIAALSCSVPPNASTGGYFRIRVSRSSPTSRNVSKWKRVSNSLYRGSSTKYLLVAKVFPPKCEDDGLVPPTGSIGL